MEFTKELKAILCNTPGKRMGLFVSNAMMELYTNPSHVRRIVRRHIFERGGWDIVAEKPVQRRNVGNIVYT